MENCKTWREAVKINLRAFMLFWKRYPQMVISRLIKTIWSGLTPYVSIYLSALVIEELAGSCRPEHLKSLVLLLLVTQAVTALVGVLLTKWNEVQNACLEIKTDDIFAEKLFLTDYVNLDKTENMEMLSTIHQTANGSGWGLYRALRHYEMLCSAVITIIGGALLTVPLFTSCIPESCAAYSWLDHPAVIAVMIVVVAVIVCIAPALSNKASSYFSKYMNLHNLGNRLFGFFGFLGYNRNFAMDMRIYKQEKICRKYLNSKEALFGSSGFYSKMAKGPIGLYNASSAAVSVIYTGGIYLFVCLKAWAGAFGLGMVTQYVASITKMADGVSRLLEVVGNMRINASALELVFEFLDIPDTMYQGSLTVEKRRDSNYEVEFRNVSFRYPGSEQDVLKNVNMKFKIGKRLAVVGKNGSGKTTFIKLLCRLYDPTEGEILLNGIDIRKYNYKEYMNIFSVVFQDFKLFAFELGQNVACSMEYDEEKVKTVLEKVGFSERLNDLPKGIKTSLYTINDKEGVNISGGEAQKIAIARAIYKDAPFIILDEPTAALDPIAEAEIYSKFDEIAGDKTAIYISHRLSSCKFCDEIAVFDSGSVVEYGTHEELMEQNGMYQQLWNAQAQYYSEKTA